MRVPFPFFKDKDGITFFSQTKSGHASAETGTDYDEIIHFLKITKKSTSGRTETKQGKDRRFLR